MTAGALRRLAAIVTAPVRLGVRLNAGVNRALDHLDPSVLTAKAPAVETPADVEVVRQRWPLRWEAAGEIERMLGAPAVAAFEDDWTVGGVLMHDLGEVAAAAVARVGAWLHCDGLEQEIAGIVLRGRAGDLDHAGALAQTREVLEVLRDLLNREMGPMEW